MLTDIAAVSGIVSSAAVALTLVYVALQLRQAERNQRGLMQQGRANRLVSILFQLVEPHHSALYLKGSRTPGDLSADELERFLIIQRAIFLSGEDSFLQHQLGLLDDASFRSYAAGARAQLGSSEGMRAAWRILAPGFGADFTAFIEGQLAQVSARPVPDQLTQWAAVLAEQAAAAAPGPGERSLAETAPAGGRAS